MLAARKKHHMDRECGPKNIPAPIFIDDSNRYGMTRNPTVIIALTLVKRYSIVRASASWSQTSY